MIGKNKTFEPPAMGGFRSSLPILLLLLPERYSALLGMHEWCQLRIFSKYQVKSGNTRVYRCVTKIGQVASGLEP